LNHPFLKLEQYMTEITRRQMLQVAGVSAAVLGQEMSFAQSKPQTSGIVLIQITPPSFVTPAECDTVVNGFVQVEGTAPTGVTLTATMQTTSGTITGAVATPLQPGATWAFQFSGVPQSPVTVYIQEVDTSGNTAISTRNLNCNRPIVKDM
jgi:hypothetical protein